MSDLNITARQIRGVLVVDLAGKITIGETNRQLHDEIHQIVASGKKDVLLNLAGVTVIDSSGLGEMIASYATIGKNGGQLKLANLPDRVNELMTITKLLTVFEVFDNESDGIASFRPMDEKMNRTTEHLDQAIAAEAKSGSSIL